MKLSQLLNVETKVSFVNGEFKEECNLNGEFTFYDVYGILDKIKTEVVDKLKGDIEQEKVAYMMIPIISDIEVDVKYSEFKKRLEKPNRIVTLLYSKTLDIITDLFTIGETLEKTYQKQENLIDKNPEVKVLFEQQEKKIIEDSINELYKKLDKAKGNEKESIIEEIFELKMKLR